MPLSAIGQRILYDEPMPENFKKPPKMTRLWRVVIEVAFIIFLFYSNLLMGEFTASNGHGKSLVFALKDVFTGANFVIAIISALIGYVVFEYLRKNL